MLNSVVLFNAISDTNHNANPTNLNTRYREFGTAVYRFAHVFGIFEAHLVERTVLHVLYWIKQALRSNKASFFPVKIHSIDDWEAMASWLPLAVPLFWNMEVWSRMFAVNVQSVLMKSMNWNSITCYTHSKQCGKISGIDLLLWSICVEMKCRILMAYTSVQLLCCFCIRFIYVYLRVLCVFVSYCIGVVLLWAWWGGPDGIEA